MNTMSTTNTMISESRRLPRAPLLEQLVRDILHLGSQRESLELTFARAIEEAFEGIARESRT